MAISILNRMPRLPGSQTLMPWLLGALFLGAGAVVGLVVATGNLILIALVLGAIGGLLLLNALPAAVWLVLGGVFLINGPVGYFWPGMAKVSWLFSLLGIFMAGAAMLYSATGVKRFTRPMPAFIYTSLAFIVLAVVSGLISDGGVGEVAAGAKRYFQFWGVMFLLAVVPFTQKQVRNWMLFLVGIALVQLPFTLYQRVVLVPTVLGYDKPGFVPFDIIVGTFEGSITGGGASSIMAMFQVLMVFAIFCAWREKLINGFWTLLLVTAMLLPLGLGETKVVLVLLPVVLFSAYFDLVAKRPLAFIGIVIATLFFGAILGYFYFVVQTAGDIADMSLGENLRDTIEYNFGKRGYYATGVNRLTAVPYWFESQSWNNPIKTLFGTGIGSSYGIDGLVPDPGHMFRAHPGMHIDLLTTSTVLWDFGIVGFILYFLIIFGAMRTVARCFNEATTAFDRVLCRLLMSSLAVTLVMAAYTNSAVVLVSHGFIVSLTLGLVAWRHRHGPLSPTAADLKRAARSRFKPRFGGGGSKVIFPTEGVMSPTMIGAWRERRMLGHAGPATAAGQGADASPQAPVDGGQGAPERPASDDVPSAAASNPFAATAAAGQSARSAFPKAGPGGMPSAAGRAAADQQPHPDQQSHPGQTAQAGQEAAGSGLPDAQQSPPPVSGERGWHGVAAEEAGSLPEAPAADPVSARGEAPRQVHAERAPRSETAGHGAVPTEPASRPAVNGVPPARPAVPAGLDAANHESWMPSAETSAPAPASAATDLAGAPAARDSDRATGAPASAVPASPGAAAVPPGATAAVPGALAGGSRPAFGPGAQIRPAGSTAGHRLAPEFFPPGRMPQESVPAPAVGEPAAEGRAPEEGPRPAFPPGAATVRGGRMMPPSRSEARGQPRAFTSAGTPGNAGGARQVPATPAARPAFPDDGRWQPPSGGMGTRRSAPGQAPSPFRPSQATGNGPAPAPGARGVQSSSLQGQPRTGGLGAGIPRRAGRQVPRDPVIDVHGPETRPMFADDDDPLNRLEPRSSSVWNNDPRGRPRRR